MDLGPEYLEQRIHFLTAETFFTGSNSARLAIMAFRMDPNCSRSTSATLVLIPGNASRT